MKRIFIRIYLAHLKFFAKIQLRKINPLIIGVGGSSGKSSTVALISEILEKKFKVKEGKGKNSETGIPLSILDIELNHYTKIEWIKVLFLAPVRILTNYKKYDIYITEMGIDSPMPPKNMDYLLSIIKPNISLLTNIEIEHSQYFEKFAKEVDEVKRKEEVLNITASEEVKLLKAMEEQDRSIINIDDPKIYSVFPLRSKMTTVSEKNKDADFYISKILVDENSFFLDFIFLKDKFSLNIKRPLPRYFAYTFILAIAASFVAGVSVRESIKIIEEKFTVPPGRFSVFKGVKSSLVIDSSYNSSLSPLLGALEAMTDISSGKRRRVAIIGDMRELGSLSKIQHEALVKPIVKNLDFAILVGPEMGKFVAPNLKKENFKFQHFQTFKDAKKTIEEMPRKKDIILVKGSQNTLFLERAVEILLEDKKDVDLLPRRGKFWDKERRESN